MIDLQLFVLGLAVIYIMTKSRLLGISCAFGLVVYSHTMIYITAQKLDSPVMLDNNITVRNTVAWMDAVHFPTHGYMADYFIGLLIAYAYSRGMLQRLNPNVSKMFAEL